MLNGLNLVYVITVEFTLMMTSKINTPISKLLQLTGIISSKYYSCVDRKDKANNNNNIIPKHWIPGWEKVAIINYAKEHLGEGYRKLTT